MRFIRTLLTVAVLCSPASLLAQPHEPAAAEVGVHAGIRGSGPRVGLNFSPRTTAQFEVGFGLDEGFYAVRLRHTPDPTFKWYIAGGMMGMFALPRAGQTRSGVFYDHAGFFTIPMVFVGAVGQRIVARPRWSASAEAGILAGLGGVAPTLNFELSMNVGRLSR